MADRDPSDGVHTAASAADGSTDARPLGALHRKAAMDAGFDLEPERDGAWWRLRASGAPGVVWVHGTDGRDGMWLAVPLVAQLPPSPMDGPTGVAPTLPLGAAAAVRFASPETLHAALRLVHRERTAGPAPRIARWEARVRALTGAGGGDGAPPPVATEVLAEVRRRVGQDLFRDALLDLWEGRCAVTGLAVPGLLRASHAKPWAVATDAERLDPYNGLLLAPHLDALFDGGWLGFADDGAAIVSPALGADAWQTLGLSPEAMRLRWIEPGHRAYLAYHRAHVWRAG